MTETKICADELLEDYVEVKRHLWNSLFLQRFRESGDWGVLDRFGSLDVALFNALVCAPLGRSIAHISFGTDPVDWLFVTPKAGARDLSMQLAEPGTGPNRTWNRPASVPVQDIRNARYLEHFDWLGGWTSQRSYPYLRVSVELDNGDGSLARWEALVESVHVSIFADEK